ncbi:MAG: large conductance mechanosensitive channel protein MscL [Dehalococcoidia bacterium]|nr:large conductance mechanosensitive channel protein MscL [Dehalococcoidia bacterium]
MNEFKKFLLRGNVLDLAVGIIVGAAFVAVINSLVKDMLTPLLSIPGKVDFADLAFTVNGSTFRYGNFLNAVIAFIAIAAVVFFFVVLPANSMIARMRNAPAPADPTTRKCPECLSEIPLAARRCAHCTSAVPPAPPPTIARA